MSLGAVLAIGLSILSTGESGPGSAGGDAASLQAGGEAVTDVNGHLYTTVTIGAQVWMVENLEVANYRDGTPIPRVEADEEWSRMTTGAYCRPALERSSETEPYGLLYNFFAVGDARGLCPQGWHVPTAVEWRELIDFLGGVGAAGGKMRATGAGSWILQLEGTTDESGFSALPAGGRGRLGGAGDVGNYATWWSSTRHDSSYAWHWGLHPDKQEIRSNPGHVQSGFSVRCVRNQRAP